jgi:V/A-type H+/Na+-transporting ATPase subunit K
VVNESAHSGQSSFLEEIMKKALAFLLPALALALLSSIGLAAEGEVAALGDGNGLAAIGAGLALGLAGVGAGIGLGQIGAAAAGAVAEKPSMFGQMIVYLALPESIVIFGFLIANTLAGKV